MEICLFLGVQVPPISPQQAMPFDPSDNGDIDLFVTKFSPTGALLASTYIGGSGEDGVNGDTIEGVAGTSSVLDITMAMMQEGRFLQTIQAIFTWHLAQSRPISLL